MLNKCLGFLFLALATLLVACALTPLTIHNRHASVELWVVAVLAGFLLLGRTMLGWRLRTTVGVLVILLPVFSFCSYFLIWGGDWMTQEIIYEHRTLPGRTIEFQMMNPGPGSYRERKVDRQRLLPGLEWLQEMPPGQIDTLKWKRVDRAVNELGIKYA